MSNLATITSIGGSLYILQINGSTITAGDYSRMNTICSRLNYIFSDQNRDLDFITSSYANGYYVVTCPLVRKNQGDITYFYDTNGSDGWKQYDEKLYDATYWSDSGNTNQTAILTSLDTTTPWVDAFTLANNIRYAVTPNFNTASGSSYTTRFTAPTNTSSTVSSIISSSAYLAYYGTPCQGTQPGTSYSCSGSTVQNISSACVANGEVFHPCDLVAALTSTNNWHTTYRNKFLKVTNISTGASIVVRGVDESPAGTGIELSYRAWQAIGSPASGAGKVKIELMA